MGKKAALLLLLLGPLLGAQQEERTPAGPAAAQQAPPAAPAGEEPAGEAPAGSSPAGRGEVFAPFVSRLKVRPAESAAGSPPADAFGAAGGVPASPATAGAVLSWRNSTDLKAVTRIYRHTAEIEAGNFDQAELIARLEPGEESYSDFPPAPGTYFYAVVLEDAQGNPYRLFIPFRNKSSAGIAVQRTATEENLSTEIRGLSAQVDGDSVILRFQSSRPARELLVFRSTAPMRTPDDLLTAVAPFTLPAGSSGGTDTPVPGVDYYYAVVDAGLFRLSKSQVLPGENATLRPVQVPLETPGKPAAASAALRPAPLPYLLIGSGVEQAARAAPQAPFLLPGSRKKLQPATARAVAELLAALPPPAGPKAGVQILAVDAAARSGGEEDALKTILLERLQPEDFAGAEAELERYLSVRRSAEIEARVHFYLAQTYYFRGLIRQALLELLLAEDRYYREVQPWLDACLGKLGAEDGS